MPRDAAHIWRLLASLVSTVTNDYRFRVVDMSSHRDECTVRIVEERSRRQFVGSNRDELDAAAHAIQQALAFRDECDQLARLNDDSEPLLSPIRDTRPDVLKEAV